MSHSGRALLFDTAATRRTASPHDRRARSELIGLLALLLITLAASLLKGQAIFIFAYIMIVSYAVRRRCTRGARGASSGSRAASSTTSSGSGTCPRSSWSSSSSCPSASRSCSATGRSWPTTSRPACRSSSPRGGSDRGRRLARGRARPHIGRGARLSGHDPGAPELVRRNAGGHPRDGHVVRAGPRCRCLWKPQVVLSDLAGVLLDGVLLGSSTRRPTTWRSPGRPTTQPTLSGSSSSYRSTEPYRPRPRDQQLSLATRFAVEARVMAPRRGDAERG